jgi:ribose transport system substrate-binding protein
MIERACKPWSRQRLAVAAVLLIASVAAGCGSSTSTTSHSTSSAGTASSGASSSGGSSSGTSSGGSSSAAGQAVNAARAPLASFDGPSTSPGKPRAGQTLDVIYSVPAPNPLRGSQSVRNAAAAVGWSTRLINAQGTPQGYVNAVEEAIASKVNGIVLVDMPVPLLQSEIRKADAAGIVVVAVQPSLPEDAPAPSKYGLFDYVTASHDQEGTLLADWLISHSPSGASVIRLTSPEFPDLDRESNAFASTLRAAGPKFKVVAQVQSPVTDIEGGSQGVERLSAAMRQNPDANYMFILSENWVPIFLQAQKQISTSSVTALGSDGDTSVPLIKNGTKIVMVGPDTLTYGWYAVDALIRAFNHKPAIVYGKLRVQLIDKTNAAAVKGSGVTATYDYAAAWKKLWGVS